MEFIDYNGAGRWSRAAIIERYARFAAEAGVSPRDLSPAEHTTGGRHWVYPVMHRVIEGIEAGDPACVRLGIDFIEEDAKFPFGKILKSNTARAAGKSGGEAKTPITLTGGHDIGPNDYGRPCVLIAAGLGVETDVFRKAFSGVTPARGRGPSREEARKNKAAMMKILAPHGVTNERLDEVANYYRYKPQDGELWPTAEAKGYAVVEAGKVKKIVITEPGSGYCSEPVVKVEGVENATFKVTLGLSKDLKLNGAVKSVEVVEDEK